MTQRMRGSGRRTFESSNEDKVLFPSGATKGALIDYYERVADWMLPRVSGRPVTMRRFPDGVGEKGFFQKDVPDHFPEWIETVEVEKEQGRLRQLTIESRATLAYLAHQACIEIHVWPSRADVPRQPDRMIFDLDPPGEDFGPVRRAAERLRRFLDELEIAAFPMTTGSRGLHVVCPLRRDDDFDLVRDTAMRIARVLVARHPDTLTVEQRKKARGDRVFVDCLRNAYAQHGVAPYSVRARSEAPVATPLDWAEVQNERIGPRRYTLENIFRRLSQKSDPWEAMDRSAVALGDTRSALERLEAR